jgi:hypothetical protein
MNSPAIAAPLTTRVAAWRARSMSGLSRLSQRRQAVASSRRDLRQTVGILGRSMLATAAYVEIVCGSVTDLYAPLRHIDRATMVCRFN